MVHIKEKIRELDKERTGLRFWPRGRGRWGGVVVIYQGSKKGYNW